MMVPMASLASGAGTIAALASAPGRAGVAVVRVSGPQAGASLCTLTARPLPPARQAQLRTLYETPDGAVLDRALVLWFPAPASFTGEDVAEYHVHGGRAVVSALLETLLHHPGLRLAEPGEFTRRAFLNGKFDLTAAEAVADLVDAETTAQRRQALRQMEGTLGQLYNGWRTQLTRALAYLEASIDFIDEEDVPGDLGATIRPVLSVLIQAMAAHLADAHRGERLRDGVSITIVGAPNAGKSSLLNALARRDVAIVAATAGTTRDLIEVHLDLGGWPVVLVDTAGLRDNTADAVEAEGVRRAHQRAASADLKLAVFDASAWPDCDAATLALVDADTLPLLNKCDRLSTPLESPQVGGRPALLLSAKTGAGLDILVARLREQVSRRFTASETPALTRARHRSAVQDCQSALIRALTAPLPELAAEDVRLASRALGRITGQVDVDDLLDVIFRDFCIGK